jgi:hypothetical protein
MNTLRFRVSFDVDCLDSGLATKEHTIVELADVELERNRRLS